MGKVYEALRRAEEERGRQGDRGGSPAAPAGPAATSGGPSPRGSAIAPAPWWRRLFGRRRGDAASEPPGESNKRRISLLQPRSYVAEQFRSLRARIDALEEQQPVRTLAVTSAVTGEGKTTAAVNFALVSSMSVGRRVLLVDCDLRRPTVHRSLGLSPAAGLGEILSGQAQLDDAVTKLEGTNLEVLPVRGLPQNPAELLASQAMRELVEELARRYDRVVLDVPCTLGLPDAKTVSELCDGILFVVRAEQTSENDVRSALEVLDRRRLLGLVLNGEEQDTTRYGYGE